MSKNLFDNTINVRTMPITVIPNQSSAADRSFKKIQAKQAEVLNLLITDLNRKAIDPNQNVTKDEVEQVELILKESKSVAALSNCYSPTYYLSCLSQIQSLRRVLEKQEHAQNTQRPSYS